MPDQTLQLRTQKISFFNEKKENEIRLRPNGCIQKIFQTLPIHIVKCFNKSWHKYNSFCIDKSEQNKAEG